MSTKTPSFTPKNSQCDLSIERPTKIQDRLRLNLNGIKGYAEGERKLSYTSS